MRRAHRLAAGLLAAGALALTGCAQSVEPIERLGRKAVRSVAPKTRDTQAAARPAHAPPAPRAAAHARWGLPAPLLPAPAPPVRKPARPFVVDRVPTRDKVVFLTFDDGAERDPRFVRMVDELNLPISMFLTDSVASPGYDHFDRLRRAGGGLSTVQNHTIDHTYLPGLPYTGQRAQICGQQDRLEARFGVRPRLFRPPYGAYNNQTLRAAGDCGAEAVVLWGASMQINDLRYAHGDRLRPGDIVLAHFRGPAELKGATITEMTTRMLRRIQEQGFAVARLEDYL
ncbi:polysaccharide deacetylase [Streptomyces agglomeratus]|uniref:Polysaccharide deacetylase n=1 Tax=Streptomyces agglomeratus TaxID=285458 RepID=A0A1E5P7J5_9ACTN|nr:polysaccharide deacetylase family protein [Streptomyces agglomeratus]OEJ25489.1 polysaccharide deacetylase [Streptomyces agglomeratus]OEJ40472.1 polysaccharide deacetylase [Streptomyces agglomeratus]OEJ45148.1 polysaccharide deacetylase [Streptomyces agglomeratus]OEJ53023.1 polysaccharide deacetylase [Streptomyces agglomeratus]OEJ60359.1 polysaccharide deacetylase [Streptomyces agglomeratus]